jgi:hypothetical protein
MCKDNLDFDDLNDMFLNEDILMTIPDNIDIIFEDIDLDE